MTEGLPRKITLSFVALCAAFTVVALVMGWQILENQKIAAEGREAHDAICAMKQDLARRVQTSRDFLKDNPQGIPGIPATVIRNSISNQQKTVDALKTLDCKETP